jgi:ABC-2 type transport system permease protein
MKLYRVTALIERDMRKFLRSPAQMMASMVFPLLQLVVLGYAFGGHIKGVTVAVVDQDRTAESRQVKEMIAGVR